MKTSEIEVAEGKTMIVQLVEIGKLDEEGNRTLDFEINGNRREIKIKDKTERIISNSNSVNASKMADTDNKLEIGASIPGTIIKVLVKAGDTVKEGDSLLVVEAMKMETNIVASSAGTIESVLVSEGQQVKTGELLVKLK